MSFEYATPLTIAELIAARAAKTPDAMALAAPQRSPLSYAGLHAQMQYTAKALSGLNVSRNGRVALVLPNGPELAAAFLGVSAAAVCAPLNPAYRDSEFDFYLEDLRAEAVIVPRGVDSPVRAVAQKHGIALVELAAPSDAAAGEFTLSGNVAATSHAAQENDVALVLHTSGTTSRPKLVPLTHANLCTSAYNIARTLRLTPGDRCLNVMPLFHIHGLIAATLSSLGAGGSVVCTPGFDAAQFFTWLEEFQPTWYTAVPTMHEAILGQAAKLRGHTLRMIRSSSSALPPQVARGLETAFGVPVIEAYGMTEAAHQMCSNPLPPAPHKFGTVGPAAGPEVAIMDDAGKLLPAGASGEIVIRGANVTVGYENNPTANDRSFTSGWFRTGDLGKMDTDGYLTITGRIKEIINRGGEKIAPREVEEALLDHPAISQCVAFAIPHATLSEDLAVAVVLRDDMACTEQEIREFAFTRLADHKVPSQVAIVEQIPKGPTGKLQRIGLYDKLAAILTPPFTPPADVVQEALAQIWTEVLGSTPVGVHHNFFGLGGDSLSATRVLNRVRSAFEVDLPVETLFRTPTIAGLALVIEERVLAEVEAM